MYTVEGRLKKLLADEVGNLLVLRRWGTGQKQKGNDENGG